MTAKYIVTVNCTVFSEESDIHEDFEYGSFAVFITESSIVAGRVARFLEGVLTRMPEVDEDAVIDNELTEAF